MQSPEPNQSKETTMNKTVIGSMVAAILMAAAPAFAVPGGHGNGHGGVNQRQFNQHERIQQGARSGELTRGESRGLRHEQAGIRQEERRYMSDGHLSGRERRDLHRDQNQASRHIWQEKHDGERRFQGPHADVRDPGVNQRQFNQRERIQSGWRSGELTRDERKSLASEQKGIRQEERAYKSDGTLTMAERRDLQQDLNAASRHIYNEAHDAERRF
jgi:hypothetical protein